MTTDDRDHVTDAAELAPETETLAAPERKTGPPNPATEPPIGYNPPPSHALMRLAGFDPDQFLHAALLAAADAAHESRENRKADAEKVDIATLLEQQTDRILRETSADMGLVRSSIHGLQQSVDALVTRIGNTETALDAGTKRFAAIEDEMAAMRSQMDRLEQMRDHLGRLETALATLRTEGKPNAAQPAEAPPKLDNPASG